jgi:hypothetical protein
MKATSTASSTALSSVRFRGCRLPVALTLACYSLAVAGAAPSESWPLPGRNVVPKDATLFLEFSGEVDTTCDIGVSGNKVESKGNVRLVAPLPKRDCFIYAEQVEGRGSVCVLQDPRTPNGHKAIIRVHDPGAGRGKYTIRAHYSLQAPEKPAFSNIVRIPDALQPHYTSDGRFLAPAEPGPLPRSRYSMPGRLWGEQAGPMRSLIDPISAPAFRWQGHIEKYAVLAFDGAQIRLFDCGLPGTRTLNQKLTEHKGGIQDYYLVLSECTPQGRVRVIQPGGAAGTRDAYLIEIDNREIRVAPDCRLTGHLIRKEVIDRLHGSHSSCAADWKLATEAEASRNMSLAAEHWIAAAARAEDEGARLWALEKFCLLQPYPGPNPNRAGAACRECGHERAE